jgi:hypothetical protein
MLDEALQRVGSLVEYEIVRELSFLRRDLGVWTDVGWVYDRGVEAGLDAMVEED